MEEDINIISVYNEILRGLKELEVPPFQENLRGGIEKGLEKLVEAAMRNPVSNGHNIRWLDYIKGELGDCYFMAIDIDHFKKVNDTYGHLYGDTVLRRLFAYLDAHTHVDDIIHSGASDVIHPHGEEFLMILRVNNEENAIKIADRLRLGFYEETKTNKKVFYEPVTFSAGLAYYPKLEDASEGNIDAALKETQDKADKALYKAKEKGRNMVEVF